MQYLNAPAGEFIKFCFRIGCFLLQSNLYKLHRKYSTGELFIEILWTYSHSHFGGEDSTITSTVEAMGVDIECCWWCYHC